MADATELVERSAELRLEDHDHRDDDEERRVAEEPRQKDQVERRRDHAHDREQDEADKDLGALRPPQQAQQLIEHKGHHGHVDKLDRADVPNDLTELHPELLDHVANKPAISAICA